MPAGRPTDYDPDILPKLPLLVDSGATDTEVADALGVSVRTVYRWKNEHPEFSRIHQTLRVTPAMEAGLTDHPWEVSELVELLPEPEAKKRGPYKPRAKA